MRTTVRLDEQLLKDAKREAAATGRTLTQLLEDALREVLARRKARPAAQRLKLRVFQGDGVQPGVDLDDSARLIEIMEGRDAAS